MSEEIQIALKGSIGVVPDGYVLTEANVSTSSGLVLLLLLLLVYHNH